jgi:hypothetical protein
MIFLPAAASFSVDAYRNPKHSFSKVPAWTIDSIKIILAIVYIYAGLAKLNSDWLLHAMPLKIWLPTKVDMPIIGQYLNENWLHYFASWSGMLYDLIIVFLLLYSRTRFFAFILIVVFHVLTWVLFPIGLFPYIMIISTLIFFDAKFHEKVLRYIARMFRADYAVFNNGKPLAMSSLANKTRLALVSVFLVFQLLFPFRYLMYDDELFWTEEGYRFSWRVMLMEKAGHTEFIVTDPATNKNIYIKNSDFLTAFQEKQMSFQPDFILQFAHHLRDHYQKSGISKPEVRVRSYVALNGRLSRLFIDPDIDLSKQHDDFKHKTWILPFNDEISGL